jgi:hypothetical protein
MMNLEARVRPQPLKQNLHHHALTVMRRGHVRKYQDLPLVHRAQTVAHKRPHLPTDAKQ